MGKEDNGGAQVSDADSDFEQPLSALKKRSVAESAPVKAEPQTAQVVKVESKNNPPAANNVAPAAPSVAVKQEDAVNVEKKVKKEKKKHRHKHKHKKDKKSKKEKKRKREHRHESSRPAKRIKSEAKGSGRNGTVKEIKQKTPLQRLADAMQDYKWWEDPPNEGDIKWNTLEHNGVGFPDPYQPHGVKLLYDGEEVDLTPAQEEICTLYAEMPLDGPQLGDPKVAPVFNKNFFADFKKLLKKGHVIQRFEKCDFSRIRAYVNAEREKRKSLTKEQKEEKKRAADERKMKFSFALVDGHLQAVANVMVEPPGLFRGRGMHPKTGMYKQRVMPEQITLNLGEDAPIPPCPLPGHNWGKIVHKRDVTWLAYWKENIAGGTKYVWLGSSSKFKGQSDIEKYEKARRLKANIGKIRRDYEAKLTNKSMYERQLGTAMWVIDRLALRVGNEKDDSEEADTVGCCSLRVEHVTIDRQAETLTLDFLGKDSMRHFQTYSIVEQYGATGKKVLNNFEKFVSKKKPAADVFDELNPGKLNDHLKSLMPGLSAKVFRTYNASVTLQERLPKHVDPHATDQEKVLLYNKANREVAILCNHQKTVSSAVENSIDRLNQYIELLEKQERSLYKWYKKRRKSMDIPLKPSIPENATADDKKKVAHFFARQPKPEDVMKRLDMWKTKVRTQKLHFKNKDENKTVALGTSKINYMDPRITTAWTKRNECPIEKVFAATLRDKFPWAMSVGENFEF